VQGSDAAAEMQCRESPRQGAYKVYDRPQRRDVNGADVVVVVDRDQARQSGIDGGERAAHPVVRRPNLLAE